MNAARAPQCPAPGRLGAERRCHRGKLSRLSYDGLTNTGNGDDGRHGDCNSDDGADTGNSGRGSDKGNSGGGSNMLRQASP